MKIKQILVTGAAAVLMGVSLLACGHPYQDEIETVAERSVINYYYNLGYVPEFGTPGYYLHHKRSCRAAFVAANRTAGQYVSAGKSSAKDGKKAVAWALTYQLCDKWHYYQDIERPAWW